MLEICTVLEDSICLRFECNNIKNNIYEILFYINLWVRMEMLSFKDVHVFCVSRTKRNRAEVQ